MTGTDEDIVVDHEAARSEIQPAARVGTGVQVGECLLTTPQHHQRLLGTVNTRGDGHGIALINGVQTAQRVAGRVRLRVLCHVRIAPMLEHCSQWPIGFMHFALPPAQRPRSTLARVLTTLGALVVFGALIVAGFFALVILLVGGALWLLWFRWRLHRIRKRAANGDGDTSTPFAGANGAATKDAPQGTIIEGEYTVVNEQRDTP